MKMAESLNSVLQMDTKELFVPLEIIVDPGTSDMALTAFSKGNTIQSPSIITRNIQIGICANTASVPSKNLYDRKIVRGNYTIFFERGKIFTIDTNKSFTNQTRELFQKPQPVMAFDTVSGGERLVGVFAYEKPIPKFSYYFQPDSGIQYGECCFGINLKALVPINPAQGTQSQCTCDTKTLFATGCVCGFLKKRKFGI